MRIAVVLALLGVTILAGCSTSATQHDAEFDGTIEVKDDQFVMDGNVSLTQGAAPDATFENVTVVLYNENKEVIRRVTVGNLSTTPPPLSQPINITSDTIPTYVVIESPDFWQSDTDVYTHGYEHPDDGGRYEGYPITTANETFPSG